MMCKSVLLAACLGLCIALVQAQSCSLADFLDNNPAYKIYGEIAPKLLESDTEVTLLLPTPSNGSYEMTDAPTLNSEQMDAAKPFVALSILPKVYATPEELSQAGETPTIVDEAKLTMSVTDGNLVMSVADMGVLGTIIPVPIHAGKSVIYLYDVSDASANSIDLPGLNLAAGIVGSIISAGVKLAGNPIAQGVASGVITEGVSWLAGKVSSWFG